MPAATIIIILPAVQIKTKQYAETIQGHFEVE